MEVTRPSPFSAEASDPDLEEAELTDQEASDWFGLPRSLLRGSVAVGRFENKIHIQFPMENIGIDHRKTMGKWGKPWEKHRKMVV